MKTSGVSPLGLQAVQGSGECSISEEDETWLGEGGPSSSFTMRLVISCPPTVLRLAQAQRLAPKRVTEVERWGLQEGRPLTIGESLSGSRHCACKDIDAHLQPCPLQTCTPSCPQALQTQHIPNSPLAPSFLVPTTARNLGIGLKPLLLIHSFNKYLVSVPGTILSVWDTLVSKTDKSCPHGRAELRARHCVL